MNKMNQWKKCNKNCYWNQIQMIMHNDESKMNQINERIMQRQKLKFQMRFYGFEFKLK